MFAAVQRLRRLSLPPSPHPLIASSAVTLWRSLRFSWEADAPLATIYLLLIAVGGAIPVATAWTAKLVLDRLVLALGHAHDAPLAQAAFLAAVWYVGLQFAGRLLFTVQFHVQGNLAASVSGLVDRRAMEVGGAIPDLDHFERKEFYDEIGQIQRAGSYQPANLLTYLRTLAQSSLSLVGTLALLVRFQPLLPLALLLASIPQVVVQMRQQHRIYHAITERSEAARMMAYCASVMTEAAAAKEVLAFGVGPWFRDRWQRLAGEALAEMERLRAEGMRASLALVVLSGLVLAASYAYVAAQAGAHRLTVGDFALYLNVVAGLQFNLFLLSVSLGPFAAILPFMARIFRFLDETRPSIAITPAEQALPAPARLRQGIELREVAFGYPGQQEPVLRNLTCTLRAGETVALVGENGAGKTTLVKLLTRLYDPSAGEILLDGAPLAAYDLTILRQRIAVLFQDFAHFALTAQQNIGVGDVQQVDNRERVLAASRWSGADAVLAKLPKGLDTPLTKVFEGGVELSGGEWQKVATARAAMRDAALVILDEPTAALDAQAEYELFARFRQLAEGRTVLLISHRFSTVRMADRILVLEGGRILEDGSHEELLALGGRYATLFEMQAGRYR
jgi:ATP-binding cassette subfamily B protein